MAGSGAPALGMAVLDIVEHPGRRALLRQVGETVTIETEEATVGRYEAAVALAAGGHADLWAVYDELGRLYPVKTCRRRTCPALASQIAEQARRYRVREEESRVGAGPRAARGLHQGQGREQAPTCTQPRSPIRKTGSTCCSVAPAWARTPGTSASTTIPYNFDSVPERDFFEMVLRA